jgi:hypothetical protein
LAAGSGWLNTEWRAYNFVPESNDAAIVETPESRRRRAGQEHPLSESEQRNLKEVAIKTWKELGFIKPAQETALNSQQAQSVSA